jgi:hypothetical protein
MEVAVMRLFRNSRLILALAAANCLLTVPAKAGYSQPGYDLSVVQSSQGLANTAISYQTNPTWGGSGLNKNITTLFSSSVCQTTDFARLYLDVWGGTNAFTSTLTASLNGTALNTVLINGSSDSNPTFDAAQTCVYGSGSGMWQIAYSGIASLLKTDGTQNELTFKVTDPNGQFDGRTICASLVTVYSDPSIHQTLDYYLAEADGTLRKTPGTNNSPATRTLTLSGINTSNVTGATYIAGYTHGTSGENDQLYFNGRALGNSSNDLALGTSSDFGPSNLSFDVAGYLNATNTTKYSVAAADVGSTGESYLRANIAILAVTHPVPEPSSIFLLLTGGGVLMLIWKSRQRP